MISFRYHLVSIVAVFLAVALGVLIGTTVVNQGVIDDLNRRTNAAVESSEQLRDEVATLQAQLQAWERFGEVVRPLLIGGKLAGRRVVLVTLEGVDVTEVDGVARAVEESGGSVTAILVVTPKMALRDQVGREDLAGLLGTSAGTSPEDLAAQAAARLGARLALGPESPDRDLLQELVAGRYVLLRGGSGLLSEVGGPGQAVVLLSGGPEEPAVSPDSFLAPLVSSLVRFGPPVVAAETSSTAYPFVPLLRGDGSLDGQLATVDNADTLPGRIAVVLALRDLFQDPGSGGDYGVKDGASDLLPTP